MHFRLQFPEMFARNFGRYCLKSMDDSKLKKYFVKMYFCNRKNIRIFTATLCFLNNISFLMYKMDRFEEKCCFSIHT